MSHSPFFSLPPFLPIGCCESRSVAFPWFLVTSTGHESRRFKIYETRPACQPASQQQGFV